MTSVIPKRDHHFSKVIYVPISILPWTLFLNVQTMEMIPRQSFSSLIRHSSALDPDVISFFACFLWPIFGIYVYMNSKYSVIWRRSLLASFCSFTVFEIVVVVTRVIGK